MIQIVAMMTMMAANCSSTRSRISFCEVLGEPPRIMLRRPSSQHDRHRADGDRDHVMRHEIGHLGFLGVFLAFETGGGHQLLRSDGGG